MSARAAVVIVALFAAAGCEGVLPEFDWQQMIDQPKLQPYEASSLFADGRAMQPPPAGTVPYGADGARAALAHGFVDGKYVERAPLPLTRELFAVGRFGYDTYCAACHGLDGSGRSAVADNMELRKPPPLVAEPVTRFPVGRIFEVAGNGYGLMPSYAAELSPRERWAVVAYVRALQVAHGVPLDALPPPMRSEAEHELATPNKGYVDPESKP